MNWQKNKIIFLFGLAFILSIFFFNALRNQKPIYNTKNIKIIKQKENNNFFLLKIIFFLIVILLAILIYFQKTTIYNTFKRAKITILRINEWLKNISC